MSAGNVWLVEGDDHEVELVEADTGQEALESAGQAFSERYDEPVSEDTLEIVGCFRGDVMDIDSLEFVPTPGAEDETRARRALSSW